MRVMFTHPTTSKYLEAEVPHTMTAEECVAELLNSTFLDDGDYQLVANQSTMSPGQSLGAAGVADGSTVVIHRLERGAGVAGHCTVYQQLCPFLPASVAPLHAHTNTNPVFASKNNCQATLEVL